VSTQLRLVDTPRQKTPRQKRPKAQPRKSSAAPKQQRAKVGAGARRAANWGQWQLDERTRRIGRAGVAAARAALEHARQADDQRLAS